MIVIPITTTSGRPLSAPAPANGAEGAPRRSLPARRSAGVTEGRWTYRPADPRRLWSSTPWPAAGRGEIEEDEAVQHGELAAVDERPETLRRVGDEIGERHQPGEHERHGTREEADQEQRAADELQYSGHAGEGPELQRKRARNREVEQLLRAVRREQKGGDDAQDAQQTRRPGGEKRIHVRKSCGDARRVACNATRRCPMEQAPAGSGDSGVVQSQFSAPPV